MYKINEIATKLKFDKSGLIPAVIQDAVSGKVLTLCYMDKEALSRTLKEKKVYVFRRSKKAVMLKGGISGHTQAVRQVFVDCEAKSLLIKVSQRKAACHNGYFTCYYRAAGRSGGLRVAERRVFDPDLVYRKSR